MLKKLVKILSTELIYRQISGMQAQQVRRKDGSVKTTNKKFNKYLKQSIYIQLAFQIIFGIFLGLMFLLPLILISLGYTEGLEAYGEGFAEGWLSFFPIIAFIWVFIWVMQQSWSLQEHRLLEPLYLLPIPQREIRTALLLLLSLSTLGILIGFSGVAVIEGLESIENFFLCLGYGMVTIFLALALGLLGGSVLATRGHGTLIKRMLSTLLIVIMCLSIALVSQMWTILSVLLPRVQQLDFAYSEFIYPFSFSAGLNKGVAALLPMVVYLAFSYSLYRYSFSRYMRRLRELVYLPGKKKQKKQSVKIKTHTPTMAYFFKDTKLIAREPRIMYSFIIFPIVYCGSIFSIVFSYNPSEALVSEETMGYMVWALMVIFGIFNGWFGSYISLGVDAKYMPLLNTLPRTESSFVYSKALISAIPMSVAYLVIILVFGFSPFMLIAPVALTFITAIITLSLTLEYLPKTSTFAKLTGKQSVLIFLPVLLLAGLAILPSVVYYKNMNLTFGISSITSSLILLAVILAASGKRSYEIKPFFALSFVSLCILLWQIIIMLLAFLNLKIELSFLLNLVVEFAVISSLVYLLFRIKNMDWRKDLGIKADELKSSLVLGLMLGLCYAPIGNMIYRYMVNVFPITAPLELSVSIPETSLLYLKILLFIFIIAIAPVCEELLFRGFLQNALKRHICPAYAILVSAILFSLLHGVVIRIPHTLILGLLLGALFDHKNSLYSNIAAHAAYNGAVILFSMSMPILPIS